MAGKNKPSARRVSVNRVAVGFTPAEIDSVEARVTEELPSLSSVVRHYTLEGIKALSRSEKPPRVLLPRFSEVPCGPACDVETMVQIEDVPYVAITDTRLHRLVTDHSFVGTAKGMSMYNRELPDSISNDDELLMVPFNEWPGGLRPGLIVLAHLRKTDGTDTCTLKTWDGAALKANNPEFKDMEFFGPDIESATAMAIAVARLAKVF